MFKDMIKTIKAKYLEMFLFVAMYILGNAVYFGYFRPFDVPNAIIFAFLIYVIWGNFMRRMGGFNFFMPQRDSWSLSESIVDNKWMFGALISVFTFAWYMNVLDFSIPMYVFFMLYLCVFALLIDKARYLENE